MSDFGAVPDGRIDSTGAIRQAFAFASSRRSASVYFPCGSGSTYRVTEPLTFPDHVRLIGDGNERCSIRYDPPKDPGRINAAFAITGDGHVTIENLQLETGPAYPPASILELGRISGGAGENKIINTAFRGYATKALVYSLASENNRWLSDTFRDLGGGALFGFYTSGKDDLEICAGCKEASNLSIYFDTFIFVAEAQHAPFVAIGDRIGGGTGDHYFGNGYIGLNQDASSKGVELISGASNQGGPNSSVSIRDIRIENGGFGLYFKKGSQNTIYSVDVEGVTWSSSVAPDKSTADAADKPRCNYFAYGEDGLALGLFTMTHNLARSKGVTGPSSFDSLIDSTVDESYGPIRVRSTASGNIFTSRGNASISVAGTQRAENIWVSNKVESSPRLQQGFGGELKAAAKLKVTCSFYILKQGANEITSIAPPPNLEIGQVLRLENGTGESLTFTPGPSDPVKCPFKLADGHFVSLVWDGTGWTPGV